ncbi:MAG: DoxX family protein [Ignavibacteriaceae bacterium]
MAKYEKQVYAIFRIMAGFLFLWHGSQKLFGVPPMEGGGGLLFYTAGAIEFFGGIMIMIGLLTRWTAFIASGEMAYAFWIIHVPAAGLLPLLNGGELAALYCFIFLFISAYGPGIWSIDNSIARNKGATQLNV